MEGTGEERKYRRYVWEKWEDDALEKIILLSGAWKWKRISELMGEEGIEKNDKQCRERWSNCLQGEIKKGEWDEREESTLFRLHKEHGHRWALIAKELEGRTDNMTKNYFYCKLRRQTRLVGKWAYPEKQKSSPHFEHSLYLLSYLARIYLGGVGVGIVGKQKGDRYIQGIIRQFSICREDVLRYMQGMAEGRGIHNPIQYVHYYMHEDDLSTHESESTFKSHPSGSEGHIPNIPHTPHTPHIYIKQEYTPPQLPPIPISFNYLNPRQSHSTNYPKLHIPEDKRRQIIFLNKYAQLVRQHNSIKQHPQYVLDLFKLAP